MISLNHSNILKNKLRVLLELALHQNFGQVNVEKMQKIKNEIKEKGLSVIKHGDSKFRQKQYEYPISFQLIKDGRKNKVLSKKINLKINVTMFHGQKDGIVPVSFSKKVLSIFTKAKKRMVILKNGDHSLSQTKNLNKILSELKRFSKQIS